MHQEASSLLHAGDQKENAVFGPRCSQNSELVGRRQIADSMFTWGHTGGYRILLGRSLHRKDIFSEEEQRAGGQWVEGETGW